MELLNWVRNQWDRVAAWVLVAIGALALILGWIGVTGTPYSFEQIPFVISGGLGGLFLLGVGAMLWLSADMRDEWRTLNELVELQREANAIARHATTPLERETNGAGRIRPIRSAGVAS